MGDIKSSTTHHYDDFLNLVWEETSSKFGEEGLQKIRIVKDRAALEASSRKLAPRARIIRIKEDVKAQELDCVCNMLVSGFPSFLNATSV